MADDDGRNQHGYPQGYKFVPKQLELIVYLSDKLEGRPLPFPLNNIFHDIRIRDFHPAELYEQFRQHEEAGYIYFFSAREFATPGGGKKRPMRVAKGGGWKASGGGKAVTTMKNGGVDVGQKLTMVFYQRRFEGDRDPIKTSWGMHEFTKIIGPNNTLAELAIYRLYKMKEGKKADGSVATVSDADKVPTLTVKPEPSEQAGGAFMANQATSQAQAQASVGQPHWYHPYEFGAAAAEAPGPSSWGRPAAAHLNGVGHAGFTVSPAPSMIPPPPVPSTMQSGPQTSPHYPPSSQQAAEHSGSPSSFIDWYEPLQMDLQQPPPLPAPAPACGSYMANEFDEWCGNQQAANADPDFDFDFQLEFFGDDELERTMFTFEQLYGGSKDETERQVKMMETEKEADTKDLADIPQVQADIIQQDPSVPAN